MRQLAWERGSRLSEALPPPKALPLEPCSWVRAEVSLVGSARRGAEWAQAISGRLRRYQGSSPASHAPVPNSSPTSVFGKCGGRDWGPRPSVQGSQFTG